MVENKSYTCDRCGQVFITDDKPSYKIMSLSQLQNFQKMADDSGSNIAVIVFRYTRLGLDLCTDCNKQLTVWLEGSVTSPSGVTSWKKVSDHMERSGIYCING